MSLLLWLEFPIMFSSSTSNKSIFLSHSFPLSLSHTFLSLSRLPLSGLLSNIRSLSSFLTPVYTISFSELTHLPLSLYLSPFLLPLLSFSRSLSLSLHSLRHHHLLSVISESPQRLDTYLKVSSCLITSIIDHLLAIINDTIKYHQLADIIFFPDKSIKILQLKLFGVNILLSSFASHVGEIYFNQFPT